MAALTGTEDRRPRWRRWAWFVGLYLAGMATMAAVSYGLRWLILSGI